MARRLATALFCVAQLMTFVAAQQLLPTLRAEMASLLFLCLTLAATIVHEAGHAIAVAATGARLHAFVAWDIGYDFTKRHFGLQKSRGHREIAGYVLYTLGDAGPGNTARARIAAAGPLANVVTGLGAFALDPIAPGAILPNALTLFAILSVGIAIANLVPFPGSDGEVLRKNLWPTTR